MAYKGSDLDLRPARPSALAREAPGPAERTANGAAAQAANTSAGPIPVDDAVLACCNCAYDVARFYGCEDVRLEHLLHALTRVGAAAEVLAELGIRLDTLRRETAVAIAAEMPAGPIEDHAMPHASAAFEDVLRRAADQAAKRRLPADLHDLLRTVLGGGPESPAATLLMRAADDPPRLERWRDAPLRAALDAAAPEAGAQPNELSAAASGALLGRLEHIEAALRALQAGAAADRQAVADLLRDVQAALRALRSEGANATAAEQTRAVDARLEARLADLDKSMGVLGKRLASIDKTAASETWQELRTLVETFEGRVGTHTLEVANRIADAFSERLGKTETGLQRLQEETERHWSSNSERQVALETSVRAHLQGAEEAGKTHERDLGETYQALVKLGANQQTLGDNFTAWRIESGGDIAIVNNRLQQLEQTMLDLLGHFGGELQALRQESHGNAGGRRNGFKRWLYGTGHVLAAGRRNETAAVPQTPDPSPKEDTQGEKKS
jgi:Clp amino terminal domain, pathogenicity island component